MAEYAIWIVSIANMMTALMTMCQNAMLICPLRKRKRSENVIEPDITNLKRGEFVQNAESCQQKKESLFVKVAHTREVRGRR